MIVGCYTIDVYCDNENDKHIYNEFPHQYIGQGIVECKKYARQDGWTFSIGDGLSYCPKCSHNLP